MGFGLIGVYENVGYKLGEWRDVGWWQLRLREPAASPSRPLALAELQHQPGWDQLLARGEGTVRTRSMEHA
jgi:phosphinothricin acetyltransferase